jgi:trehalose-6-phosphate synthase
MLRNERPDLKLIHFWYIPWPNREAFRIFPWGEGIMATKIYVGADRIDYTKGIPERLRAFDEMLKRHPELRSKVSLMQLAEPSRTHIEAYRNIEEEIENLVDEINWQHQDEARSN